MSNKPLLKKMKINKELISQPWLDHKYQPVYFVADSFKDALNEIRLVKVI